MDKYLQGGSRSAIESILVLLLLLALMWALYDVLRAFFGVLTFALIFSVSFAGPFEAMVRLLGNRRKIAAVIYSLLLLGIVALPFMYIIAALRSHVKDAIVWIEQIKENGLPPLPHWIQRLPYVGDELSSFWQELQDSPKDVIASHSEQLRGALRRILTSGAGMLGTIFQCITGIVVSAFFLASGEKALDPIKSALTRLLGRRDGLSLLRATNQAIKSVSIGVMGTAFIAAILSWVGLTIAGIGFAIMLSALVFFLVLLQLGPLIVWVPLVIWSATQGHPGTTVFLIIYGIGLLVVDALLKPVLIAKSGGRIPFLVLFIGVIGGLASWGFTGMFKGAIIVSVFYTLFTSWLEKRPERPLKPARPAS
ncbi:AI-2E family transporter [Dinghuibacter silviterrae]|uniref:Putative PurR-regulated permease PerM n=1 Tax=Dinghuibacter silviterrae TaxID=1539049 RepID=A0A4R8DTV5_9BACT|nr:AI-2E family transporter [Dinghuibacter silviterrae]TDX00875.1 putative PurR-regulated permease PerM [Dinghuibacter silviterrae]